MSNQRAKGFTLIEVLIALAIVAIAVTAVIKATSQNIRSTGYLQTKTLALWTAQNVISQAQMGLITLSEDEDTESNRVQTLNQTFYWQGTQESTPNKNINKLTVKVFGSEAEESPLITLTGYRYDDKPKT